MHDSNYVYIRNNKSGDNSPSIQHMVSAQSSISNLNDLISDSNKHGQNFLTINTGESGSRQNLTACMYDYQNLQHSHRKYR
jgi:hypothetical protein